MHIGVGNDFLENNTRVITLAKSREDAEKQFGNLTLAKILLLKSESQRTFRRLKADFVIYCSCRVRLQRKIAVIPKLRIPLFRALQMCLNMQKSQMPNRFCSYLHIWFTGRFSAVIITFAKTTSAILIRPMPTVHTHKVCVQPKHLKMGKADCQCGKKSEHYAYR